MYLRANLPDTLIIKALSLELPWKNANGAPYKSLYIDKQSKGIVAEAAALRVLKNAGYEILPCRLSGNKGLDGVFIKRANDGTLLDIIITESKYSHNNAAKLSKTKAKTGEGVEKTIEQMSQEWIEGNIEKMLESIDPQIKQTGNILNDNMHLIRRKINVQDKTGYNRWNILKPKPSDIFRE